MAVKKHVDQKQASKNEVDLICEYTKLRYSMHVSQRDLTALTGIAQSTIARLETNLQSATLRTFIKMLDALGYHLEIKKNSSKK